MCWKCDNPDATEADYLKLIREAINSPGWFTQYVEKGRWSPAFAYTIGLTEIGHPELFVTGLAIRKAGQLLGTAAHGLVSHDAPAYVPGDLHVWLEERAIEVVEVAVPTEHLVMASATYGPDIRAVQLVYADDRGRWPSQVGFRGNQPVLGPRAGVRAAQ